MSWIKTHEFLSLLEAAQHAGASRRAARKVAKHRSYLATPDPRKDTFTNGEAV